jgi:magnesium transporter
MMRTGGGGQRSEAVSKNHSRRHHKRRRAVFGQPREPVGATPGTLVIREGAAKPVVRMIQYGAAGVHEEQVADPSKLRGRVREDCVTWIDVQGLGDEQVLRTIAEIFHLPPLELEDIVNVPQRPKVTVYNQDLLIVTRMAMLTDTHGLDMDQVSIVLGSHFVLTFQERYGDVLDPVRNRIRQDAGTIRKGGPDFLAYAILDATIDGYYPVLEELGERLEDLEHEIIASPRQQALLTVHDVKRELLAVRRGIWPQREMLNAMIRDENPQISQTTRMHLRDCYDHCVQIIDVVETYRELSGGLMDLYLSSVANRQNDIMRVLTVIATIFMPLTFMAGVYGMNFEHMPELKSVWGYPALWAVMATTAGAMLVYFGRKGWLRP